MFQPIANASLSATVLSVLVLGLRHGADPDHLAAIDNLTRNSLNADRRASRFVGTIFAGGHAVMVTSIAALVWLLGSRLTIFGTRLETAGAWISIATLFFIAALNVRQLVANRAAGEAGFRLRLLPRALRVATSPLAAVPIGLLFGFGFDTPTQLATYALVLTTAGGILGALLIGLTFFVGMAVTDTLDSLLVHHLCTRCPTTLRQATRTWIAWITVLAIFVGTYELAQTLGWRSPFPDMFVSGTLVLSLLAVFAWICSVAGRRAPTPST